MNKAKHVLFFGLVFFGLVFTIAAEDISQFMNLGFSENEQYFMFGQFGIREADSTPYAEMAIVDVAKNSFVNQGIIQYTTTKPIELGQDGINALFNLINKQSNLINRYNIDHLNSGRLIYLHVDGLEPQKSISFRDFNTKYNYTFNLIQASRSRNNSSEASYHIDLRVEDNAGRLKSYTVGLPGYYRENVSRYLIRQIIISPNNNSAVIVVEKIDDAESGSKIQYMVETVRF